jgi:hypothetical protein
MKIAAILAVLCIPGAALCAAPAPIPIKEPVAGIAQSELTKRWWQWGLSLSPSESPLSDPTGAKCTAGQEGPIWFLAGMMGGAPTQRTCHIPAGKSLFFPILTYVFVPQDQSSGCTDMIRSAREATDGPSLFAELDGEKIPDLDKRRVTSGNCFNAGERRPGEPMIGPAAANGYWLAFPPLSPGRHKLHFGGVLPTLKQDLTYTLIVD